MLRQRVAPTDVGECTSLVTWYAFGVPERLEIVRVDGGRELRPLHADGSLPVSLGVDPGEIDRLEVYLSIEELRALTIIDTPGLQSANDSLSRRTRELLAIDEVSRRGVAAADVLLLVMALEPHQDDIDTLRLFDAQFGGLSRNALNAVGVLSRIDHLGVGPADVRDRADALAERFAHHHHLSLAAVIPVNGLVAETIRCGVLTERDAEALTRLLDLSPSARRLLLLSADRFVGSDAPVSRTDRLRLLTLLDLHGIGLALAELETTGRGGAALGRRLQAHSGIDRLAVEVFDHFGRRADAFKVGRALAALHHIQAERGADRARVVEVAEHLALDPLMLTVHLVRVAQQVANGEVSLPDALAQELVALVTARVDVAIDAVAEAGVDAPHDAAAAALNRISVDPVSGIRRWRSFSNDSHAGPAAREVAEVVLRTFEAAL